MAEENQSSSECIARPRGSASYLSLTSREDLIHTNCCAAGSPRPQVRWESCQTNSTDCNALSNATQSTAELKLTGNDLPRGNSVIRCVAKYLDVTEALWTISLDVDKKRNGGKT